MLIYVHILMIFHSLIGLILNQKSIELGATDYHGQVMPPHLESTERQFAEEGRCLI